MRRKDDTLRGTLLDCARQTAQAQGPDAVNIRAIARKAGIATGTVYNYFANKDEILLALTEDYWEKTLLEMQTEIAPGSFCKQLEDIFAFLRSRIDRSAGMLMRSLGGAEAEGKAQMTSTQSALEAAMLRRMEQDPGVRRDIWSETFSRERYARFLMMNMMLYLKTNADDFGFFLTIVKRTIY